MRCLVLMLLLLAGGCRQPTGMEHLLGERARTPPPSGDGSCDFDLSDGRDETVFRVLGVLDEYLGRAIVEDEERIEGFYCNEPVLARWFRGELEALAREQGLPLDVRVETAQECLTAFHGRAIAERLNSCYRYQASSETLAQVADGSYRRTAKSTLSSHLFLRGGTDVPDGALGDQVFHRRRALAYVEGAWARYGQESRFVFANSFEKAHLVGRLLTWLAARDVHVAVHQGRIPAASLVEFTPSDEIAARLRSIEKALAGFSTNEGSKK